MQRPRLEPQFSSIAITTPIQVAGRSAQSNFLHSQNQPTSGSNELLWTEKILVLQFGSANFRVGMSRDPMPTEHQQVIRHSQTKMKAYQAKCYPIPPNSLFDINIDEESELLEEVAKHRSIGRKRSTQSNLAAAAVSTFNADCRPHTIPTHNDVESIEWARGFLETSVHYVCGRRAFLVDPHEAQSLCLGPAIWPVRRGRLFTTTAPVEIKQNIKDEPNTKSRQNLDPVYSEKNYSTATYSRRNAVDDLLRIWTEAILQILPKPEWKRAGIVLVTPQNFFIDDVHLILDAMLRELGFAAVTAISETIAATFGVGASSALVVDLGAQKSIVAAVDEGQIQTGTLTVDSIGGDDLTLILDKILQMRAFPYHECDASKSIFDWELVNAVKESFCGFEAIRPQNPQMSAHVAGEAFLRRPGEATRVFPFRIGEERFLIASFLTDDYQNLLVPPSSISNSSNILYAQKNSSNEQISGTSSPIVVKCDFNQCSYESSTVDDLFLHYDTEHSKSLDYCGWCSKKFESDIDRRCHVADHIAQHFVVHSNINLPINCVETDDIKLVTLLRGIRRAITDALDALDSVDRLRKVASSLLILGAGGRMYGLPTIVASIVQSYVIEKHPTLDPPLVIELVLGDGLDATGQSAPNTSVFDGASVAWKGGAVYSRLESTTSEAWITQRLCDLGLERSFRDRLTLLFDPSTCLVHSR